MQRVLVTYGSKYGATAEIAELIGEVLGSSGVEAEVTRARSVRSLDGYAGVVAGSAVYAAHWRGEAVRFLVDHEDWLAEHPVWLFSSGPVGEDDSDADEAETERWTKPKKVQELSERIQAKEHVVFGGMIAEDRGFVRKRMARGMPEEARDRRDWDEIAAWAAGIASHLVSGPALPDSMSWTAGSASVGRLGPQG